MKLKWIYADEGFAATNPNGAGQYRISRPWPRQVWLARLFEQNRTITIGEFLSLWEAREACEWNAQCRWEQDLEAGAIG